MTTYFNECRLTYWIKTSFKNIFPLKTIKNKKYVFEKKIKFFVKTLLNLTFNFNQNKSNKSRPPLAWPHCAPADLIFKVKAG